MRECGFRRGRSIAFDRLRILSSLTMTVWGDYCTEPVESFQYCHAERRRAVFAGRSRSTATAALAFALFLALVLAGCSAKPNPKTLVMIIESSPINLDPRVGVDGQSQRIDELLFDSLLRHDDNFNLQPQLADRWEISDPLTYVFHLHHGVRFTANGDCAAEIGIRQSFQRAE